MGCFHFFHFLRCFDLWNVDQFRLLFDPHCVEVLDDSVIKVELTIDTVWTPLQSNRSLVFAVCVNYFRFRYYFRHYFHRNRKAAILVLEFDPEGYDYDPIAEIEMYLS